jgi:hypothetical protein
MGQRIFSLDVNPAMIYTNKEGKREKVDGTHWTEWPCTTARFDPRTLEPQQWFNHFLVAANISFFGRFERPPYIPEQASLIWD